MANIPNRAIYGLLGCLKGIVDSRFYENGQPMSLSGLKHDTGRQVNSIDVCPGGKEFHPVIAKRLGRTRYCPFLDSNSDTRMCEWVHAVDHDPQKSKPIGQCAVILEGLGFAELIKTKTGKATGLTWTAKTKELTTKEWGSKDLDTFLTNCLLEYGPVLGVLFWGNFLATSGSFDRQSLVQYIKFPISNDSVDIKCDCGENYKLILPDGNTSSDAATRSTTALLSLAASAGLIYPSDEKYKSNMPEKSSSYFPSYFYSWQLENPSRTSPRKWEVNNYKVKKITTAKHQIQRGLSYLNLVPKSTDRNATNRCEKCSLNMVNLAKKKYGGIVANRRYLILESLRIAFKTGRAVSLKQIALESQKFPNYFVINKGHHLQSLETDLQIAQLSGLWLKCDDKNGDKIFSPQIGATNNAFGPAPKEINHHIKTITQKTGVLV